MRDSPQTFPASKPPAPHTPKGAQDTSASSRFPQPYCNCDSFATPIAHKGPLTIANRQGAFVPIAPCIAP